MKAAIYHDIGDIRIADIEQPVPGPGEVLMRVKACGVCGTDLHIYHGDPGAAEVHPPTVLGHEAAGVVEAIGEGVTSVQPGDTVVLDPNETCGKCKHCLTGKAHYCTSMKGYGTTLNGSFAEYMKAGEKAFYKTTGKLSFEEYSMSEPVACCLRGIDKCNIRPGHHVVIIGAGGIGLLMLQLAKMNGASRILVVEPSEPKRKLAEKLGATVTMNPMTEDIKHVLIDSGMPEPDTVIECVGKGATIETALDIIGPCGTVMMFGLTSPDCVVPMKPLEVFFKEINITSSFINPYTMGRAVDIIESRSIDVKSLIETVLPLDDLVRALTDEELRAKGKIIIKP